MNRFRHAPPDHYLKDMMLIPWRHPRNPEAFTAGVNQLGERFGADRAKLTGWEGNQVQMWSGGAAFVRAEGKLYVVARRTITTRGKVIRIGIQDGKFRILEPRQAASP